MSQEKKMRVFKLTNSQLDLMLDAIDFASTFVNPPFMKESKIIDFQLMKSEVFEGYRGD